MSLRPFVRVVGVGLVAASCSRPAPGPERAPGPDAVAAPPVSDAALASDASERQPLAGFALQVDLVEPPEGGLDAGGKPAKLGVVAVPLGAREPRPLMIALHGGSDHPEWACTAWRGIANGYPFLVCPRGTGTNDASLAWASPGDTKARIARAISATRKTFGSWVRDDAPVVLVGFSMGATQAALLARLDPKRYSRVALAESAYAPEAAMSFAGPWSAGGGERAIFLCTTLGCEAPYRSAARNVAQHRAPARLVIAGTNAHGMWNDVVRAMRRDWPWFVEGLAGWETYAAPAEESPLPGKTELFEPR